ncbi:MAG: dTDP-4-amino-4,6-dideoxygalactose transaminase [Solirubrobacteraceae bacterium]|nr:dTDP-4-amino-4,6-dideoxygalactose transaminase [Solirubrobacteraceae bacterium]
MFEVPTTFAAPHVPFTQPVVSRDGADAVAALIASGELKSGGALTRRCSERLQADLGAASVLMVQSCTAALELSAILLDLQPGDEVIMPSFGFASAANAFVLRGTVPVFVDICEDTLNIDPARAADAITDRTRAIVPVHYAGIGAPMERLLPLAAEHGLAVIEDAAQAIGASYRGRPLGTFGALGTFSFDATKNLTCGTGGALVVNDPELVERAEWIRDCGTDRAGFARGESSRYQWVDAGSNYALNELAAAYLAPQLDHVAETSRRRRHIWDRYHAAFAPLEAQGVLRRPIVPEDCEPNGHAYGVIMPTPAARDALIRDLAAVRITASFHFVPLHSAPAGLEFGRTNGPMHHTDALSSRLVRMPLWTDMTDAHTDRVIAAVARATGADVDPRDLTR